MAMHVVPSRHFSRAVAQARPWLPTLRVLTKELRKYPDAELVEVEDGNHHVHIRTQSGRLLIDVTEPGETVHVACPLAMIEDVSKQLEARTPTV
jgi:ferredoxin-NADP reductase